MFSILALSLHRRRERLRQFEPESRHHDRHPCPGHWPDEQSHERGHFALAREEGCSRDSFSYKLATSPEQGYPAYCISNFEAAVHVSLNFPKTGSRDVERYLSGKDALDDRMQRGICKRLLRFAQRQHERRVLMS